MRASPCRSVCVCLWVCVDCVTGCQKACVSWLCCYSCFCPHLCVTIVLHVSLDIYLCGVWLYFSKSLCVSLNVSLCESLALWRCLRMWVYIRRSMWVWNVWLWVKITVSVTLAWSLTPSWSLSEFISMSLRASVCPPHSGIDLTLAGHRQCLRCSAHGFPPGFWRPVEAEPPHRKDLGAVRARTGAACEGHQQAGHLRPRILVQILISCYVTRETEAKEVPASPKLVVKWNRGLNLQFNHWLLVFLVLLFLGLF